MPTTKPTAPRKRNRKRKRRLASSLVFIIGVKARSPSPSPPPVGLPPFLPSEGSGSRADEEEQALRNRFRQFWMASVADAFSDDLERIRKEPSMTKSRLALLIDSLASGGERGEMNEMEVVLNSNHDD
ncbi:hypothetical protein EDB85DRAFT_1946692 [Lactarius pseudohatsudake]|nr:hypothetical protein EDB85DRAFT_1946692 [Lactarius pseudohatsudake]